MKDLLVPVCNHPTTVLFVDDNQTYLKQLRGYLDSNKAIFNFLSDPMEALEFLRQYKPMPFTGRCITRPEEDAFDRRSIDIDVSKIWREIYYPQRFAEISVVVVDYAMPGLNGLDFARMCRLLQSPFKILLLTGEAGESKAVTAFNEKVIDKFIRKDTPNIKEVLNNAIYELQNDYFLDLSRIVIDSLIKDPDNPTITWLDEPCFLNIFNDICQKQHIAEYYLTDSFGSYIFLDINDKPSWLLVKAEEDMEAAYQVAQGVENLSLDLLKSMEKYQKILYLHEKGGLSHVADEIKNSLHHATKVVGNKSNYYYAFVDDPNAYNIHTDEILSYKDYQRNYFQANKVK